MTGLTQPGPRRLHLPGPPGSSRHGELTAGLATAALLAQLLFAPVALAVAAVLAAAGALTRWRPPWLALPLAAGLIWTQIIGAGRALSGFASGPWLGSYLRAADGHPARLAGLGLVARSLPGQLPIALIAGAAEAGLLLWLGWWRRAGQKPAEGYWRRGVIAATRRRAASAALARGRTVTANGCAIGIKPGTGRRAELSWAELERGALACGPWDQLAGVCLAVVCAALRRRRAVIVVDLAGAAPVAGAVAELAAALGVPVRDLRRAPVPAALDQTVLDQTVLDQTALDQTVLDQTVLGQVIRGRAVALAPQTPGCVAQLAAVLASWRDLRLRGDTLAWIHGCEAADRAVLAELLGLGPQTGTGLLLSTSADAPAAAPAEIDVTITITPAGRGVAQRSGAGQAGGSPFPEWFAVAVRSGTVRP
jgi:hypothetical protein